MKTIRHKWINKDNIVYSGRDLRDCERCHCKKWYDYGFKRIVFYDRFGKLHYTTPDCVLPNTKMT